MKIGLIFPREGFKRGISQRSQRLIGNKTRKILKWGSRNFLPSGINLSLPEDGEFDTYLSLTLPHLASLIASGHEIRIINENVEEIDVEERFDLIGITVWTAFAKRAYELATIFRGRGAKVILGGPHVTLLPEEGKTYADSVVIGEAEQTWPQLLQDAVRNELKPFYRQEQWIQLQEEGAIPPFPRRDLVDKSRYVFQNLVLTGRGCPFDCHFCTVTTIYGKQYRHRTVAEVIREIERLEEEFFIFVDDNLFGNRSFTKELFQALIPLGKTWRCDATINIANNEEMVSLMAQAGCRLVSVGLESFSSSNLKQVHKLQNRPEKYGEAIRRFHEHGIGFWSGLIVGFDEDDPDVFENVVRFCAEYRVDFPMLNILIPYPGTKLYAQMKGEGRILHEEWDRYNGRYAVFQPKLMSVAELEQGFINTFRKLYSIRVILRRISHWGMFSKRWWEYLLMNLVFQKQVYSLCDIRQEEISHQPDPHQATGRLTWA